MQPTEREKNVFTHLAQGGEGKVIQDYIERLRDDHVAKVIDNPEATETDLKAARMMRDALKDFAQRFVTISGTGSDVPRFD